MSFRAKLSRRRESKAEFNDRITSFLPTSVGGGDDLDVIFADDDDGRIVLKQYEYVFLTVARIGRDDMLDGAGKNDPILDMMVGLFDDSELDLSDLDLKTMSEELNTSLCWLLQDDNGDIPDLKVKPYRSEAGDPYDKEIFKITNMGKASVYV